MLSKKTSESRVRTGFEGAEIYFPPEMKRPGNLSFTEFSGKFDVLDRLLTTLRYTTKDRIVLVSNYTETLDLMSRLCIQKKYPCLRYIYIYIFKYCFYFMYCYIFIKYII